MKIKGNRLIFGRVKIKAHRGVIGLSPDWKVVDDQGGVIFDPHVDAVHRSLTRAERCDLAIYMITKWDAFRRCFGVEE